jgi:hypothetical protein
MLTAEAFWNKAKINIEMSLEYRDRENNAMFQFWATIGLELLGKSCLAHIHPVMVINPEDFKSIRIACGNLESNQYKTIIAKTLYDRLRLLVEGFDEKTESFCIRMAQKRNEELHSSNLPFDGVDLRSWQNQYWKVVKLLCEHQDRNLEQLIGSLEAESAEKIIANAGAAVEVAIKGRIKKAGVDFKKGKDLVTLRSQITMSEDFARNQCTDSDTVDKCPSCGGFGVLRGSEVDDEFIEYSSYDMGTAQIRIYCQSEEFKCAICSLRLSGIDELSIAGLPEDFETEVFREVEYEPDYGND